MKAYRFLRNVISKLIATIPTFKSISDNNQRFLLATDDYLLSAWEWNLKTGEVCFNQRFFENSGAVLSEAVHNSDHLGQQDESAVVMFDWVKKRVHPQDKDRLLNELDDYIKAKASSLDTVFRIYDANYQCLKVHCRGTFARNSTTRMLGVFTFLSAKDQIKNQLNRYAQIEQIMTELSKAFLTSSHEDVEKSLMFGLKLLTQSIGGSRICLMYSDDEKGLDNLNVYEWSEFDNHSMSHYIENLNEKELNIFCNLLLAKSAVFMPDSELEIKSQENILEAMNSAMAIGLPLYGNTNGKGCLIIGFDYFTDPWRKEDLTLLRSAADLFFIILDRESVQAKLLARQEILLENQAVAKIGSWVVDGGSKSLQCTPEVFRIFELEEDQTIDFDLFYQILHPEDRDNVLALIKKSNEKNESYDIAYRIITPQGKVKYIRGCSQAILDSNNELIRLVGSIMDVTEHKLADEKNRLSAIMFDSTQEGALITDKDSNIIAVNQAFTRITGYREEEALGQNPRILSSGLHDAGFYKRLQNALRTEGAWQGEIWNRRKNGNCFPEWLSIKAVYAENNEILNFVATFSDISELKKTEEQIEHLSHYDSLTGLPNRFYFQSRLSHSLDLAKRKNTKLAVIYINLDHFKNINDSLGYCIGDEVLVIVTERLTKRLREADTLARMGGDEFIMLLEQIHTLEEASHVAKNIQDIFSEPVVLQDGESVFIGASIGISSYPNDGATASGLISYADAAVTKAKESGRNTICYYTPDLTQAAQERMQLEGELRRALIEQNELQLYYQPQVSMINNKIVGAEALLRWHHPQNGVVSPMVFLPVAEKSGLMAAIDFWVFETACKQQAAWKKTGFNDFILAINITKYSFMDINFIDTIKSIINKTGVDPQTIELEITEGALIEPGPHVIETIAELNDLGFTLAIDDFGTGYSSLAYLQRFNVDKLKIDRSFVKDVLVDSQGEAITTAIISMAKSLNLQILAEGVETKEQLALLKEKGCEVYQGFYFSKPVQLDDFEKLMRGHKPSLES